MTACEPSSNRRPRKLVLAVIDALKPEALERTVGDGGAPVLAALMERGTYLDDCVSAYPSVTPVCAASIGTGAQPHEHRVPAMNWWHRGERRYVEYGSSFSASRTFGVVRSLTDTIYNLNLDHIPPEVPTVFERLDDAGLRTAGTTYLIYRGRFRHEASRESALARLATTTVFRHAVWGPRELFYADLFASRRTGCRSQLGLPGVRDQHAGCVGRHLVEQDLFDFLLLSLPDNDTHSHKYGPRAQTESIAQADKQLQRLAEAAGGIDAFLEQHAVIVMGDHSQSPVEAAISLADAFEGFAVAQPEDGEALEAEVALCPSTRSAMLYALDPDRHETTVDRAERVARRIEGVDLVARRRDAEASVWSARGELRFAPGDAVHDLRGGGWQLEGELEALDLRLASGRVNSPTYPDALGRLWSALGCPTAGDLLLSAAPGYEFTDWGGADHVGGGSHGSLHRTDSLGVLLCWQTGADAGEERMQWSIRDVAPMVWSHFGVG